MHTRLKIYPFYELCGNRTLSDKISEEFIMSMTSACSTQHVFLYCTQGTKHMFQCTHSRGHHCISNAHTIWSIPHLQSGQSMEHITFPIHKEHWLYRIPNAHSTWSTSHLQCIQNSGHVAFPVQSMDHISSPIHIEQGTTVHVASLTHIKLKLSLCLTN
jgi:hypothetical protein